jgi:hypothetical protein
MSTQQYFFQVVDPDRAQYIGGFTALYSAMLCNGLLGKLNADGTVQPAVASDKATGFISDNRTLLYRPTDIYAAAGELVTLVSGTVQALAGSQFFIGNTLPAVGDPLYSAAGGKMDVTGTNHIGRVIKGETIRAVPNTTENVVLIDCHFGGKDI